MLHFFSVGFHFKQPLFFMYIESTICSFKQSKPVLYTGLYLEMKVAISFGFGLFSLPLPYHPEPFLQLHLF